MFDRLRARLTSEEGVTLAELMVAISILAVVMTGTASGLTSALQTTALSRDRIVAANLAQEDMDQARSISTDALMAGATSRQVTVGTTVFTVERTQTVTTGSAEAAACTAFANSPAGRGEKYMEVNVDVTWPRLGSRPPVRSSTIITPSIASYEAGKGAVAVTVTHADVSQPFSGLLVELIGPGGTTVNTSAIGCAFFESVGAGDYTVRISRPGHVDEQDRVQVGTEDITVTAGETTDVGFAYDRAASLALTIAPEEAPYSSDPSIAAYFATYDPLTPVQPAVPAVTVASSGYTLPPFTGSGPTRTIGGLFPSSGGWVASAGCPANAVEGSGTALTPQPGETASGTVRLGFHYIDINVDSRYGGIGVAVRPAGAVAPCDTGDQLVGTLDGSGDLKARVALPYGQYQLSFIFVGGSITEPCQLISPHEGSYYYRRFDSGAAQQNNLCPAS